MTMQEKAEIAGMIDMRLRELMANDGAIKATLVSNPEYLKKMLQENIIDEVKADLKRRKAILAIDYEAEKQTFLQGKQSRHTRRAYTYALKDFEKYIQAHGIENRPLYMSL